MLTELVASHMLINACFIAYKVFVDGESGLHWSILHDLSFKLVLFLDGVH